LIVNSALNFKERNYRRLRTLPSIRRIALMIVFTEKIAPLPPKPVTDDETVRKLAENLVQDDRWVKNLIDGLAGILRDVKQ